MAENICPRMLTINETSKLTGLAKHYIRQLAITKQVKTVKAGNKYLININKLIDFLNADEEVEETKPKIEKIAR